MTSRLTIVLLSVLSVFVSPAAHAQFRGDLTVAVMGLRSQDGNLCLKLFNGSAGFPNDNDRTVQRTCLAIAEHLPETPDDPFSYTFRDLPSGTYAVAIYHDSNGDEQLNRGAFGMPSEAYGFSNDAPAVNAPPSYEDAVFLLAGASTTLQIQLRYPQ